MTDCKGAAQRNSPGRHQWALLVMRGDSAAAARAHAHTPATQHKERAARAGPQGELRMRGARASIAPVHSWWGSRGRQG